MTSGILTFGSYTFPATLAEFSDNFSDTTPQTVKLPGIHGGYNQDGDRPPNTAVGKVTVGFNLVSQTREGMDDLRDAVRAMVQYGRQQLTYQPTDPADSPRFCWAVVNYIAIPQRKDEHTDLHQKVTVTFHVPDPHWYVDAATLWRIGDGHAINDAGLTIGSDGTPATIAASGLSTTGSITNNGNAETIAEVAIRCDATHTFVNPTIRRIKNGETVDEFTYTGTIANNGELLISGKTQAVLYNGVNVFGANFSYEHPDFLRLEPGANDIRVISTSGSSQATVSIWFMDTYR